MATKDHSCLSFKSDNQHFVSSNQNGAQYNNLNLNENQKCSSILETFQSNKSISTSSNSKKNDYVSSETKDTAATSIKVLDQIDFGKNDKQNKLSFWNKNGDGLNNFSNDSNIFGSTEDSKKCKSNNPNSKKISSSNNSTLSLHITAYENSIEAQNEFNSPCVAVENDGKTVKAAKNKAGKTCKGLKDALSGTSSMVSFEIPRQQNYRIAEPEVMLFRAGQRLGNPNNGNIRRTGIVGIITMPAFEHFCPLGSLYDACTDTFTGTSLLRSNNIRNQVEVMQTPYEHPEIIFNDSISEKQRKLEIDAEATLKLFCLPINAGARARYMTSSALNGREVTGSVVFKVKTLKEHINLNSVEDQIILNAVRNSSATHIVTGIQYGGHGSVEVKYKKEAYESKEESFAKVECQLGFLKAQGQQSNSSFNSNSHENFEFKYHIDAFSPTPLPSTFKEAKDFIVNAPSWIRKANGGKGVPISYELTPVCRLAEFSDRVVYTIDSLIIQRAVQLFEKFMDMENRLCQMDLELESFSSFLGSAAFRLFRFLKEFLQAQRENRLNSANELRQLLIGARSGHDNITLQGLLLSDHWNCDQMRGMVDLFERKFLEFKPKFLYINNLLKNRVICVGRGTSLEIELMRRNLKTYCVYYCNWPKSTSEHGEKSNFFMDLVTKYRRSAFVFVDLEVNSASQNNSGQISTFVNGFCSKSDFFEFLNRPYSRTGKGFLRFFNVQDQREIQRQWLAHDEGLHEF